MSIFHYQELWTALVGVAAILTAGAFLFIVILVRRARWESNRRYFEISLLINEVDLEAERLKVIASSDVSALEDNNWFRYLQRSLEINPETAAQLITEPRTSDHAIEMLEHINSRNPQEVESAVDLLRNDRGAQNDFNEARSLAGRPAIKFRVKTRPQVQKKDPPAE